MNKDIVFSGFGGQGVLTAGKILMYVAYKMDYKVTWFPTYGNQVRGGEANCDIVISDKHVLSPYAENPNLFVALSEGALDLYEASLVEGADCFVNSSIVPDSREIRNDVNVMRFPATERAQEINNERSANLVMLGYMIKHTNIFSKEDFETYMCEYFETEGKGKHNARNLEAFRTGYCA